jgi:hypothetical protein
MSNWPSAKAKVICDAGGKSANNAIHLIRPLMILVGMADGRSSGYNVITHA